MLAMRLLVPSGLAIAALIINGFPASVAAKPATSALLACPSPQHHDGDAIRCGSRGRSMRLYGIDAPEMPGACRRGRQCAPGDPIASRDHLRSLTARSAVLCRKTDIDHYGRAIVQCFAGAADLSCMMVRDGFAIERYGRLRCARKQSGRLKAG